MEEARLVRIVRFRARHRYARPEWSEARNREVFGAQAESHAHDWRVEAHVRGRIDAETGWAIDLRALDQAIEGVMEGWAGGDLNRLVPEVASGRMMPSTEELARWLFRQLEGNVPAPAELVEVRVFESDELGAAYPA